jgi:hypothetical protein
MRLSTWSIGVGVLMVAFPMSKRCARAEAPHASVNASPIESAKAGDLKLDRIAPAASIGSSSDQPIWTVAFMQHTKNKSSLKRGSILHPKAPNLHTRPVKKKSALWPFGGK